MRAIAEEGATGSDGQQMGWIKGHDWQRKKRTAMRATAEEGAIGSDGQQMGWIKGHDWQRKKRTAVGSDKGVMTVAGSNDGGNNANELGSGKQQRRC
ncbi:hypothetical protein BHE74_00052255 [Ensete ventricosum]|nr:hypothetical protein GW17_00041036 [Ensete ventricosum]RWW42213.1 hypothetical protein BHE74_00052255 [Ensete ventricosum]